MESGSFPPAVDEAILSIPMQNLHLSHTQRNAHTHTRGEYSLTHKQQQNIPVIWDVSLCTSLRQTWHLYINIKPKVSMKLIKKKHALD